VPTSFPQADSLASTKGGNPSDREAGHRPSTLWSLGVMLIVGVLAGIASGVLVDGLFHRSDGTDGNTGYLEFHSEFLREKQKKGLGNSAEEVEQFKVEKRRLHKLDAALSVGLAGLVFCALFGLGRGISAGFSLPVLFGTAGGALLASTLGAVGGYLAGTLDYRFEEQRQLDTMDPMYQAMIKHSLSWIGVAVGVGLTGVLPTRRFGRIVRAILTAVAAAVVAGISFAPISAMLFPALIAEISVPMGTGNRILWTSLPGVLMALVVGRLLSTDQDI
jgi:hypothetical protein